MAKAVKCPVCEGAGQVDTEKVPLVEPVPHRFNPCHGCGGKGWVEVADNESPYGPYPICPYPYPVYPHYPQSWEPSITWG